MRPSYQDLQSNLKFDELMKVLDDRFQAFADHRASNTRYRLADVLKAAFAMFSLKAPSLLDFKNQTSPEQSNLQSIYRIEKPIPCDNQMRAILDPLDPGLVREVLADVFKHLCRAGLLTPYRYWQQYVIVSMDGVEHFSSTKVHCPNCRRRKHRDGQESYHHGGLAAVMVHPGQREVFPMEFEPIIKQDGERKNDCELSAAKRLCEVLFERYPELPILLVEDALYANAPHIQQITGYGWKYILNVKPDGHKKLFKQFESRRQSGQVKEKVVTGSDGIEHYYAWTDQIWMGDSDPELKVNFLLYEQREKGREPRRWTWITNLELNRSTVEKVEKGGRARWKIENETFNTLKNQGYHFEHNYGHGFKNLASIQAVMMMLAFLVDQIQQGFDTVFQQLRRRLGSKGKLWEMIRGAFRLLEFEKMEQLYYHLAAVYKLKLE